MKMDSDALKFNPQVMALAMPTESGFTKAAEGITGLGKVFQDQTDREQTQKLNALKMEEANQSIIGKQNENSVFGENQLIKQNTYREEKRKRLAETDGIELKNKKDIQEYADSGATKKVMGLITPEHYMKDGKFNLDMFNQLRTSVASDPSLKDNIHLIHAAFDTKLKGLMDIEETGAKITKENVLAEGYSIDNKHKPQHYIDESNKNKSIINLNNTNATIAPIKVQQEREKIEIAKGNLEVSRSTEKRQGTSGKTNALKERIDLAKVFAGEPAEIDALIPGFSSLNPTTKQFTQERVLKERVFPKVVPTTSEDKTKFGADTTHKVHWENPLIKAPKKVVTKVETQEEYVRRMADKK